MYEYNKNQESYNSFDNHNMYQDQPLVHKDFALENHNNNSFFNDLNPNLNTSHDMNFYKKPSPTKDHNNVDLFNLFSKNNSQNSNDNLQKN